MRDRVPPNAAFRCIPHAAGLRLSGAAGATRRPADPSSRAPSPTSAAGSAGSFRGLAARTGVHRVGVPAPDVVAASRSRQRGRRGAPVRRGRRPSPRRRRPATTARRSPRSGPCSTRSPTARSQAWSNGCPLRPCRSFSTPWICAPTSSVSVRPCAVASVRICSSSARPSEVTWSARASERRSPSRYPGRRGRRGRGPPGGPARPGRPNAREAADGAARRPLRCPRAVPAVAVAPRTARRGRAGRAAADPRCRLLRAGPRRRAPSRTAGWVDVHGSSNGPIGRLDPRPSSPAAPADTPPDGVVTHAMISATAAGDVHDLDGGHLVEQLRSYPKPAPLPRAAARRRRARHRTLVHLHGPTGSARHAACAWAMSAVSTSRRARSRRARPQRARRRIRDDAHGCDGPNVSARITRIDGVHPISTVGG